MNMPLHERIRADFEARILSGALAPGERLPIELELMDQYGCSRMTVHRALSALAGAGLVERRKKAGTVVARPRVHAMVMQVPDLGAEIVKRGQAYAFRLHRRSLSADGSAAPFVVMPATGPLLELVGVHLADGHRFAVEHRVINAAVVPEVTGVDFADQAPGSWLLQHIPWTAAETRISALGAASADAALLGVAGGTPLLSVERWTWRDNEPVTHVRQLFLAGTYDLTARFGPEAG